MGYCKEEIVVIEEHYFADGEANFTIPRLNEMAEEHVLFILDWRHDQRYLDLSCFIAIADKNPRLVTVVIPFLPTATMERESFPGSLATANTDAKMLSYVPCRKHIVTFDLHTLQNQFFFHNTNVTLASTVPLFIRCLREGLDTLPAVVFPDDGAMKRYGALFADFTVAACSKVRGENDERVVVLDADGQRDVAGKVVWIVDDLVRSGGTLIECAKAIKAAGATYVCVYVTHAAFAGNQFETKLVASGVIDKFYTTDSVLEGSVKWRANAKSAAGRIIYHSLPLGELFLEMVTNKEI